MKESIFFFFFDDDDRMASDLHDGFCVSVSCFLLLELIHNPFFSMHKSNKQLRSDVVPKTAENFRALCTGEREREKRERVELVNRSSIVFVCFFFLLLLSRCFLAHRLLLPPPSPIPLAKFTITQARRASARAASPSTSRARPSTASSPSEFFNDIFASACFSFFPHSALSCLSLSSTPSRPNAHARIGNKLSKTQLQ